MVRDHPSRASLRSRPAPLPRVDFVLRDAVKPALRDKILREAVHAA
jgi:hypothetical protein